MSYFGPVWSSLKFSTGKALLDFAGGYNQRLPYRSDNVTFKNVRHKSALVHIAKQLAMSTLEGELNLLVPRYRRFLEKKLRDVVLEQQKNNQNFVQLIKDEQISNNEWGRVTTEEEGRTIQAVDRYGDPVPEALIIYIEDTETHAISKKTNDPVTGAVIETPDNTRVIDHIDLSPQISVNSSKNIVLTQVQGRDYTRKELVSGGDISFSVSGTIVSHNEGEYPESAVKKFIQIMQYNGIVHVKSMLFDQFNVDKIVIRDFSLSNPDYKNIQPYSFSCVAIEPDEDVKITQDTISILNRELQISPMSKWYKFILNSKWGDMATSAVVNTASSMATQAAGRGLDELLPNI